MAIFPSDDPDYAATYAEESAMVDAAELIAAALEKSGLSQAELARRLGVSRSEVTHRLRGERNITVRSLAQTLHVLGHRLELTCSASDHQRPAAYLDWRTDVAIATRPVEFVDAAPARFEFEGMSWIRD